MITNNDTADKVTQTLAQIDMMEREIARLAASGVAASTESLRGQVDDLRAHVQWQLEESSGDAVAHRNMSTTVWVELLHRTRQIVVVDAVASVVALFNLLADGALSGVNVRSLRVDVLVDAGGVSDWRSLGPNEAIPAGTPLLRVSQQPLANLVPAVVDCGIPTPTAALGSRVRREPHKKNLIALDGGGVRGLCEIFMLSELERVCGLPVFKLFDCAAGTSTGALLAAGILVQRRRLFDSDPLSASKDVERASAHSMYRSLVAQIFDPNHCSAIPAPSHYVGDALYEVCRREFGTATLFEMTCTEEQRARISLPRIVVVATLADETELKAHAFSSFAPLVGDGIQGPPLPAWEALAASASAPAFLPLFRASNGSHYADGGLLANDPTLVGFSSMLSQFGITAAGVGAVVSFGTGACVEERHLRHNAASNLFATWHLVRLLKNSIANSTLTANIANTMMRELHVPYVRFNPTLHEDIPLDTSDPITLDRLEQHMRAWLATPEVQGRMRALRDMLTEERMW